MKKWQHLLRQQAEAKAAVVTKEIYNNSYKDYKNGDDFFSSSAASHVKDTFKIVPAEKGSDKK